jgi:hypothetical protein
VSYKVPFTSGDGTANYEYSVLRVEKELGSTIQNIRARYRCSDLKKEKHDNVFLLRK